MARRGFRLPDRAAQKERADAADRERGREGDMPVMAVHRNDDRVPTWRDATPPGQDPDHFAHQRLEQLQREPPNPAYVAIFAEELGLELEDAYCAVHFRKIALAQPTPRQYRGPPGFRRLVLSSLDPFGVLGVSQPAPEVVTHGPVRYVMSPPEPTAQQRLEANRRIQHAVQALIAKDLMRADDRGFHWVYVGGTENG
jgi:hypothetical protein